MDQAVCAALLDVASPALPSPLTASLRNWERLNPEQRKRAADDLRLIARLMTGR